MIPESAPLPSLRSIRPTRATRLLASAAGALLVFLALAPFAAAQTPTMIVMRAVPAKLKKGETAGTVPPLTQADIAEVKINGKPAAVKSFEPVLKGPHTLQLMVLLDSMQMIGGNGQFDSIKKFMNSMPPNVEIGVGYMLQSKVVVAQDFTTDRTLAGNALKQKTREEAASPKNDNGNPYSCLRYLAGHWPQVDPGKLRAVLMFTDGIERNNNQSQGGDQLNPDVDGASRLFQASSIIPYPFYYLDFPLPDPNRPEGGQLEGQQFFSELTANTGGEPLYEGQFSPGSFDPLLDRLYSTLQSQAIVTVDAPGAPGKSGRLDIKSSREDIKILAPDTVTYGNVLKSSK